MFSKTTPAGKIIIKKKIGFKPPKNVSPQSVISILSTLLTPYAGNTPRIPCMFCISFCNIHCYCGLLLTCLDPTWKGYTYCKFICGGGGICIPKIFRSSGKVLPHILKKIRLFFLVSYTPLTLC